jgi:hypothetical protein
MRDKKEYRQPNILELYGNFHKHLWYLCVFNVYYFFIVLLKLGSVKAQ